MKALVFAICFFGAAHLNVAAQSLTATNMDPDWVGINGWAWYIGYTGANGYTNESAAQEFVTRESGRLVTLEASVDKSSGGAPLVISFYEAISGRPGAELGRVEIPAEEVGSWARDIPTPINTFDVSAANVTVDAGERYFVTFTTPVAGAVRYRAILTEPNANSFGSRALYSKDGGVTWITPNIVPEIGMRLYVEPAGQVVQIDVLSDSKKTRIRLGKRKPKPLGVEVYGNTAVSGDEILTDSLGIADTTIPDGTWTAPIDSELSDLNGDGILDLTLHFNLSEMKTNRSIDSESVSLELTGISMFGTSLVGADFVEVTR